MENIICSYCKNKNKPQHIVCGCIHDGTGLMNGFVAIPDDKPREARRGKKAKRPKGKTVSRYFGKKANNGTNSKSRTRNAAS